MSPTQRARAHCKANGWESAIVERWNAYAGIRQDVFGFADLLILDGAPGGVLAVQVTSGTNHAARMAKLRSLSVVVKWLDAPARAEVWSFAKKGERGKRKLWTLRREPVLRSEMEQPKEAT